MDKGQQYHNFIKNASADHLSKEQQKLRLLLHGSECQNTSRIRCSLELCVSVREILAHIRRCSLSTFCEHPDCISSKTILNHFRYCTNYNCLLCGPVRNPETVQIREQISTRSEVACQTESPEIQPEEVETIESDRSDESDQESEQENESDSDESVEEQVSEQESEDENLGEPEEEGYFSDENEQM